MTKISLQFCPSCGRYWIPGDTTEAARKVEQRCRTCHVKVEYSWLGFTILGLLLFLLLVTSLFQGAEKIGIGVLVLLLGIAVFKAVKQYKAIQKQKR